MNECLRDAAFVRKLPLPGNRYHFQLYRDKTRTVAVAFTGDEPDVLEVLTDAPEVVLTDLMGNRRKVRPKDGRFRVTISGDPTYMQVDPDHAIAPGYDGLLVQPNLAVTTLGATAAASSVEKPKPANGGARALPPLGPKAAISGDATCYTSAQAYNGRNRGWDEDDGGKDKWPDWFEVKLPRPAAVSRVRVYHDYGAWERTLRDYDVQAFVGGQWKTVGQSAPRARAASLRVGHRAESLPRRAILPVHGSSLIDVVALPVHRHLENPVALLDGVHHIHPGDDAAEDRVFAVQVRTGDVRDEELAAARVRPGVGH